MLKFEMLFNRVLRDGSNKYLGGRLSKRRVLMSAVLPQAHPPYRFRSNFKSLKLHIQTKFFFVIKKINIFLLFIFRRYRLFILCY